mmetsp:Transcript_86186/g.228556  ORF Transcript_86186/g.228556 Transcript_86186/m.228556 type:complete len:225 (-) Transcript_86186:2-676(-)
MVLFLARHSLLGNSEFLSFARSSCITWPNSDSFAAASALSAAMEATFSCSACSATFAILTPSVAVSYAAFLASFAFRRLATRSVVASKVTRAASQASSCSAAAAFAPARSATCRCSAWAYKSVSSLTMDAWYSCCCPFGVRRANGTAAWSILRQVPSRSTSSRKAITGASGSGAASASGAAGALALAALAAFALGEAAAPVAPRLPMAASRGGGQRQNSLDKAT